jgi:hypothetical protein
MPRGDKTGPMGYGSLTGRRMGFCAGFDRPGFANPSPYGRGLGRARGRGGNFGRGLRCGWLGRGPQPMPEEVFPYPPVDEPASLQAEIDGLEKTLAALKKRLDEVKGAEEE